MIIKFVYNKFIDHKVVKLKRKITLVFEDNLNLYITTYINNFTSSLEKKKSKHYALFWTTIFFTKYFNFHLNQF